jgi:4-aminobutyrate aminotransferase-like enzyme
MAKGLGSGLPISCVAASEELMQRWTLGTHGGTYGGGSLLPLAAACATIEVLEQEQLALNAQKRGKELLEGLLKLQQKHPILGDVRGKGLMVATEFSHEDGSPAPERAKAVLNACLEQKLLMLACGTYGNVLRWIPPLVVNEAQIQEALGRFEQALANTK